MSQSAHIPTLRSQRQVYFSEFKASLLCILSFRPSRALVVKLHRKQNKTKQNLYTILSKTFFLRKGNNGKTQRNGISATVRNTEIKVSRKDK